MQEFPSLYNNVTKLNHLCDICLSRFPSQGPWPWFLDFIRTQDLDGVSLGYTSILQLTQSAGRSCHLCTLLLEAILPERMMAGLEYVAGPSAENCFQLQMLPASGKWILRMRHLLNNKVKDLLLVRALRNADSGSWTLQASIGTGVSLNAIQTQSTYNIHPLIIPQIKEWLGNCLSHHTECRGMQRDDYTADDLSFRLIDVGMEANCDVHLVDSHNTDKTRRYITLSYRWTAVTAKTSLKASNKTAFYKSIFISDWPQIYKETLHIARQLEVRYIWIDSLCIVQDDEKDWMEQAAHMDAIYMNGLLNLAGIEGHQSEGLSMKRNPLRVSPCSLISNDRMSNDTEVTWLCFRPDDFEKSVNKSPLYVRGWTFQERVLSKRTVHFGDQIFWECACLRASEAFPLGTDHPDHCKADDAIIRMKKDFRDPQIPYPEGPFSRCSKLHMLWSSVIRIYSGTKLTKVSDRLIALRGIANYVSRSFGLSKTDYMAGLWKPFLAQQLLWAREQTPYTENDRNLSSCLTDLFPSWSWASCPGTARFISINAMLSRSFIKLEFDGDLHDYNTRKGTARLLISGRLIPCEEFGEQIGSASACLQHSLMVRTTESSFEKELKAEIELDRPNSAVPSRVQLLPVLQALGPMLSGLILSFQGLSESHSIYRRLGVFYCDVVALQEYLGSFSDSGIPENPQTIFGVQSVFQLA